MPALSSLSKNLAKNLAGKLKASDLLNEWLRYNPLYARKVIRIHQEYDDADPTRRAQMRDALLQRSLGWARRTLHGRGRGTDITEWPVVTKEDVRDHTNRFRASRIALPARTGGTTGSPTRLWRSFENIVAERVFIERLVAPFGLDMHLSRLLTLRADQIKDPTDSAPPFGIYKRGGQNLVLSNAHLSDKTIGWFVQEIAAFGPQILYTFPSMLENLLRLVRAAHGDVRIPVVLTSSETLPPRLFEDVAAVFGGKLIDYYGHGERMVFAYSRGPHAYVFSPLYGKVELRRPVGNGAEISGLEVVSTGYWNKAVPLVRYATGDLAEIRPEGGASLAAVEAGEATFGGIQGRISSYLVGPEGQVISGLTHILRDVPHLIRAQFVQDDYECVGVHIVAAPEFSPADEDLLLLNLRNMLPPTMRGTVVKTDSLVRLANGKVPIVIRRVKSHISQGEAAAAR